VTPRGRVRGRTGPGGVLHFGRKVRVRFVAVMAPGGSQPLQEMLARCPAHARIYDRANVLISGRLFLKNHGYAFIRIA
jgi:hypothetical protein